MDNVTPIRAHTRPKRQADAQVAARVRELNDMLTDPRYAGWTDELQACRDELVQLTAPNILAA